MKRLTILIAAIAFGTAVNGGNGQPGAHFIESWDLDEDGQVTQAEVTERRGDIFVTFDEEDDGVLSAQDYVMFDAARASDQEDKGQGGQGHGGGNAQKASVGMELGFNGVDGNGSVSLKEFMNRSVDWFQILDRNQDGVVTTADFGRRG